MQVPVQQVVVAEQALGVQQVHQVVEQVSLVCWQVSPAVQAAPLAIGVAVVVVVVVVLVVVVVATQLLVRPGMLRR